MADGLPYLDGEELRRLVGWPDAVDAIERALLDGTAPGNTPLRTVVDVAAGQLLLMPAEAGAHAGVKLTSVRATAGEAPRIQGVYLLLDATSLSPLALQDAVVLTQLRTAAVSAVAARRLAVPDASRLVVFGRGPQSDGHVEALRCVRPIREVTVVGRDQRGVEALPDADLVACCTTAREPLFDSALLRPDATVVAVGSHEPDAREVDTALVRRATVVVETRASALVESGDVLLAIADGVHLDEAIDGELADLVNGRVPVEPGRPRLFKSVGEAWGDLVLASLAFQRR
ncbi:MAG: ornithine cyclodeaminase family protein [Propionibacteriales bacterium]|nr:ornithine cyclodeaminase family protein [Propionibacteriales bacterium]